MTDELMQLQDSIIDAIPTPIFFKDIQGRYLGFNKAFEEFFGKNKEQLIGKSVFDINPEHLARIYHQMDTALFEKKDQQTYESQVKDANGILHDVIFHKATMTNSNGEINGLIGTILDITERKRAEEAVLSSQRKLSEIIDFLPDATFAIDNNKCIIIWNKAMERISGLKANEVIGKRDYSHTVAFYGRIHPPIVELIFENDESVALQYENFHRDGDTIYAESFCPALHKGKGAWVEIKTSPLHDPDGHVIGAIESIRDISDRKKMENTMAKEKNFLETTLISIGDGVISVDIHGNIILLNRIVEQLTKRKLSEVKGQPLDGIFNLLDEFTRERHVDIIQRVIQSGQQQELPNHAMLVSSIGLEYSIEGCVAPILDIRNKIVGAVLVFRNISDKKSQREKIEFLSYHDALTGLYNRCYFEEEMNRIYKSKNLPISLIIGDLNGLKLTNDVFGHETGDKLLTTIASVMKRVCREDDIVARWGGDEFTLLMPRTDEQEAESIVRSICEEFSKETIASIQCSISMGFDCVTSLSDDIYQTLKNAEEKMYRVKSLARNRFRNKSFESIVMAFHHSNTWAQGHSRRVSEICGMIGNTLKLTENEVTKVKQAGFLHDIGKIALAQSSYDNLIENCQCSRADRHPIVGYRLLNFFDSTMEIADIVLLHHEDWIGSGYPKGLKFEDIPLGSRIIRLADFYDHLVHAEEKESTMDPDSAVHILQVRSGYQFDPSLVAVFLDNIQAIKQVT